MAHMHYKGTGKAHSFKGKLLIATKRRIRIQGAIGAIAWRITKFQIIQENPGASSALAEAVVKLYRNAPSSIDAVIDFDDDELLAAAYWEDNDSVTYNHSTTVIFTNELFNRDIFVTAAHASGHTEPMNYYVELEEVKIGSAGLAQLAVAAARRTTEGGT